ncbi:MAG: DegT/DnrJ/EryC1/StrS family aminotransferase [Lentisphaerae bacterium]|jgi:perosamine synthetase|nr:DegT/DnrJ/EryC1/StrS family aminotransferase [Lentisphaerota bacterium]MBT4821088.1 DegT/DnrJ/EryC1/StrS family aminotransferase [Lentisphaerota bacterium]MBT5607130.1 DegT/DnrJ/EryC1/StrS family aminotransferase [Lentisphaerota bacterium]MBT7053532.1 DegT/DnrJ/EryC1/StrS family aminotransferase [Lentisphaerota bacterium]MBT7842712.1 DegT/DnrJ/EryC1/StrS family aminotransferase [Lentisphaerota bacterium]
MTTSALAINGGSKALTNDPGDIFTWPIVTEEDESAVLEVLRRGGMSGTDVTKLFEEDFSAWMGTEFALGYPNGTESLRAAMWACGVGAGDEIICPSLTYWASATPALSLGAAVHFADAHPDSLCIDPADIEHRIGPRTKAIVVVHYAGHPGDMDAIMPIAKRHGVKVIEDVSHAQGSLYKGRMCGTIGDVGAMSLMAGKSLAIGEAGILVTDNREIYERCVAYGHYERTGARSQYNPPDQQVTDTSLQQFSGMPMGGYKHRMHQLSSAMGRVQLRHYPERIVEIQKAMNRFWDLLEDVPGITAHRPAAGSGSTMGGWYFARGLYRAEELGGLTNATFAEAVRAEGVGACGTGANAPLHTHNVFHYADLFGTGKPTMVSFTDRDVRQGPGTLPVSENSGQTIVGVPWFKHDRPEIIEQYAAAYRKVAEHADELKA